MNLEFSDNDVFVEKCNKPITKFNQEVVSGKQGVLKAINPKVRKKRKREIKKNKESTNSRAKKSKKREDSVNNTKSPEKKLTEFSFVVSKNESKPSSNGSNIFPKTAKNSGLKRIPKDVQRSKRKSCHQMGSQQSPESLITDGPSKSLYSENSGKIILENIQWSPMNLEQEDFMRIEKTIDSVSPKKIVISPINELETLEIKSDSQGFEAHIKIPSSCTEPDNLKNELELKKHVTEATGKCEILINEFQNKNIKQEISEEKLMHNSELHVFLLKKIIKVEFKKQSELEEQSLKNGKKVENLISESEHEILKKFFDLRESACRIFVRMLGRKKSWHRVNAISYKDISDNLENEFEELNKENYVNLNIAEEDLKTQIELLNKTEVLKLCKEFNVFIRHNNVNKKESLINALINETHKQKSVMDMFKGKNSCTRVNVLKSAVIKYLGMCVKLNQKTLNTFNKVLLLHSFAHFYGDEEKRFQNELLLGLQVHKNYIRFPSYKVLPVVVFETQADLEEYQKALLLNDCCEIAIANKNFNEFVSICLKAKEEFKKLLNNEEYKVRFMRLKSFLRKFSAGTVYARILTKYCKTFKKQINQEEVINTVNILLCQNIFLTRKKGEWYEILSKAWENQKENNLAAEVLIRALDDPDVNKVQKLTLQLRGQMVLNKKTCGINNIKLRDSLCNACIVSVKEPCSIEIKGKALAGNESGHKSVYVQEFKNGKVYATVEERAILHYKSVGFTQGYHSEGFILQSIYFLLFFDIIYGVSPEGVFLSSYQEAPLDFYSSSFYNNRKEEIDLLLSDMVTWNDAEIEARIKDSYNRNYGTTCLVKWKEELTPELFCEVAKCITMPVLVQIFQRFVRNFREVRSGFPDLTLWNPEKNMCKFVEVKSPNDRLSPAQRIWLNFLKNIGLDCEVCNVKNLGSWNSE